MQFMSVIYIDINIVKQIGKSNELGSVAMSSGSASVTNQLYDLGELFLTSGAWFSIVSVAQWLRTQTLK